MELHSYKTCTRRDCIVYNKADSALHLRPNLRLNLFSDCQKQERGKFASSCYWMTIYFLCLQSDTPGNWLVPYLCMLCLWTACSHKWAILCVAVLRRFAVINTHKLTRETRVLYRVSGLRALLSLYICIHLSFTVLVHVCTWMCARRGDGQVIIFYNTIFPL